MGSGSSVHTPYQLVAVMHNSVVFQPPTKKKPASSERLSLCRAAFVQRAGRPKYLPTAFPPPRSAVPTAGGLRGFIVGAWLSAGKRVFTGKRRRFVACRVQWIIVKVNVHFYPKVNAWTCFKLTE